MNKIPTTLEEAVQELVRVNKKQLKKLKKEEMTKYHFSTGINIRNAWGLWDKNSTLHKHFFERFGLQHADDMSGLIFDCFKHFINNEEWNIKDKLLRYVVHWSKFDSKLASTIKLED
jgi:hypothetical protein